MIVSLILALAVAIPAQPPKTLEPDGAASIHRGHGAGIVRFGTNGVWSGMLIGGYTFNDKQPADVVAMLDAASALLKDAPR